MVESDSAKTVAADVERILDDMFSKTPKGSFIEWHLSLGIPGPLLARQANFDFAWIPEALESGEQTLRYAAVSVSDQVQATSQDFRAAFAFVYTEAKVAQPRKGGLLGQLFGAVGRSRVVIEFLADDTRALDGLERILRQAGVLNKRGSFSNEWSFGKNEIGSSADFESANTVVDIMNLDGMAENDDAKTVTAEVERVLEDLFSKTPKGSYIEWYTDLYNLGFDRGLNMSWSDMMPDVVASGVEARLKRDPSLARFEGRVKKVTDNVIATISRKNKYICKQIGTSFSSTKAACRTKALAWKMFENSSEACGLPNDMLNMVNVLV
ncbi:hypothetical protein COCOBI_02-8910 [Coccomyxa sp. Obi]|nr:hypothetical protein COCOBI_02-8910 [Coccomyxa sp. Obi]